MLRRLRRSAGRHLQRARDVERFVRQIVAGGLALVAGLWLATLVPPPSAPGIVGVALVVLGVAGLVVGIRSELSY